MSTVMERAESFIWHNARLLERRLFAYHFKQGSRAAVIDVLRGYQNADGGFGNALEPDIRCPDSQPVPVQHALDIMDGVGGLESDLLQGILNFLPTITTEEGGLPFTLPTVMPYPHAPWWSTGDNPPASLNPTAGIVSVLHRHGVQHPWLERATEFCWRKLDGYLPEQHDEMRCVLEFAHHVPDHARADHLVATLHDHLLNSGLVGAVHDTGYVRKPLDWAPTPNHPCRTLFSPDLIEANLDALIAGQQPDGGWAISWPPVSPTCELEWRGFVTLNTLMILKANGRLN